MILFFLHLHGKIKLCESVVALYKYFMPYRQEHSLLCTLPSPVTHLVSTLRYARGNMILSHS